MNKRLMRGARAALALAACAAFLTGGCGDSRNDFVFTAPQAPLAAPQAVNDTVDALGNATLEQATANGVLANDTLNGAAIVAFDSITVNGGTVALNSDGSFTYTAPPDFRGSDSFTYTLGNAGGQSTATVTLNVPALGFFVDNTATPGGSGRESAPYDNLNDALADPDLQAGDTVFVFRGNGTSLGQAGAITLPQGVNLIGEGEGLLLQTIVAQGQQPVLEGPITLMGQNSVAGFLINNSGGDGIRADSVAGITIHNNTFRTPADDHIELVNVAGEVNITENRFEPLLGDEDSVLVRSTDTNGTWNISNNIFLDDSSNNPDDGVEFNVEGNSVIDLTMSGNQFSSSDNASGSFDYGLGLVCSGTSRTTLNASNNTVADIEGSGIFVVLVQNARLSGLVNGNHLDNAGRGIEVSNECDGPVELELSNNVISNTFDNQGVYLNNGGTARHDATYTITNNEISDTNGAGLAIRVDTTNALSQVVGFVLNNTITLSTPAPALDGAVADAGELCLDIENNTVNHDMLFEVAAGGSLAVEEFGSLELINTFATGAGPVEVGTVTPVSDGHCQTL